MDVPLNTVPIVALLAELEPFEVDALDSFAAWLTASGKLPCVFDLLMGVNALERYRVAKAQV